MIQHVAAAAYERIVVVAHSFGAIIAVDALPKLPNGALVTIGASFGYVATLEPNASALLTQWRERVTTWIDFTSKDDPVASGASNADETLKSVERPITLAYSPWDYVSGAVHSSYFTNSEVRKIVREAVAAP